MTRLPHAVAAATAYSAAVTAADSAYSAAVTAAVTAPPPAVTAATARVNRVKGTRYPRAAARGRHGHRPR